MWVPSPRVRLELAASGLAILVVTVVLSFYGPINDSTFGPMPVAAQREFDLLMTGVILSAGLAASCAWRGPVLAWTGVAGAGIAGAVLGVVLAFGIWKANTAGGYYAPFTLQGALVLQWGIYALVIGWVLHLVSTRANSPGTPKSIPAH